MPTAIGKIIGLIKFHFSKETSGRRTWNIMVGQICPLSPTLASPDLNHHDVETMFMYHCSKKTQMDANGWKNLFSSLWLYIFSDKSNVVWSGPFLS